MRFEPPLIPGRLLRRYKRFLSDVALDDGREVTAHVANPGSMLGLVAEGARVWLSVADNPARKLQHSWELVEADGALVGVNAGRANALAREAVVAGRIAELTGYADCRTEVRYGGNSRIDLLLRDPARPPCYVEVKNVHLMRRAGLAEFPDSVTKRGTKHLRELREVARTGDRAVMLYVVQRGDCTGFAVAADIDPAYAEALAAARADGVEAYAYACNVTPEAIELDGRRRLAL